MSQGGVLLLVMALSAQSQQHVKVEQLHEQMERYCLTQAIYYEARGEGERGQLAVADVILQRKNSKYHPNTICGVVYQPYQFSFVSDCSMLREIDVDAWTKAAANGTAYSYPGNTSFGATRNARIDYVWYSRGATALVVTRIF